MITSALIASLVAVFIGTYGAVEAVDNGQYGKLPAYVLVVSGLVWTAVLLWVIT